MDLKECYQCLGGDFEDVLSRLRSEKIIKKFILKFLDDASFFMLRESITNQNKEEAFRAAHTLKGVCQNLSFTLLYHSAEQMTEALREGDCEKASEIFSVVSHDYDKTVNAIKKYKNYVETENI